MGGSGSVRTSRSSVVRLVGFRCRWDNQLPGRPPRASPMNSRSERSLRVRRAYRSTSVTTCSTNVFLRLGSWQRNRRTCRWMTSLWGCEWVASWPRG